MTGRAKVKTGTLTADKKNVNNLFCPGFPSRALSADTHACQIMIPSLSVASCRDALRRAVRAERTLPDPPSFPAVAEPAHGIHSFLEVGEGLRWPVLKAVPSFRQSSPCCLVLVSHSQENTYVTGRSGDVGKRRLRRTV